ncbi:hypothetical protein [Paenibacillus sp. NPDC057967]
MEQKPGAMSRLLFFTFVSSVPANEYELENAVALAPAIGFQ